MLALIAGSAILLGGAAMPRFCLQNQTLLYVLGEARMALGDHEGGLQMIGSAANQSKDKASATEGETASKPAVENKDKGTPVCTRKPAVQSPKGRMVVMVRKPDVQAGGYLQLAKLEKFDFDAAVFEQQFDRHMQHEAAVHSAAAAQNTLRKVRMELERQGIAVPPAFPAAPVPPTFKQ